MGNVLLVCIALGLLLLAGTLIVVVIEAFRGDGDV